MKAKGSSRLVLVLAMPLVPVVSCATGPWLPAAPGGRLGVSETGRYLTLDGGPFFWLADTAWLLTQVPAREEIDPYVSTRAEQGFTVVQLTAVAHIGGVWRVDRPTTQGDVPFAAMRSEDDGGIIVYFAGPAPATLRLEGIAGAEELRARWVNPSNGQVVIEDPPERGSRSFTPPSGWEDALLSIGPRQ